MTSSVNELAFDLQLMTPKQWIHYIKSDESQPLTRKDLQYDVLNYIFADDHKVFTHPTIPNRKVSFRDLYLAYIMGSPKSSKALKEKMAESQDYTDDILRLLLLANVGRISSSMSSSIRTYHPVPAFQRTNGSLQDAPRLKSILKAALLPIELRLAPSVPADILSRASEGKLPPTSVCNLLFVLAYHTGHIGSAHFSNELEFMDLFLPVNISSESRARAFLFLCYHYLESSAINLNEYEADCAGGNPFCDPQRPGKAPAFVRLTQEEAELENIDSEVEKSLAEKLVADRHRILQSQAGKQKGKATAADDLQDDEAESVSSFSESRPKGKQKAKKSTKENKGSASDKLRKETLKEQARDKNQHLHTEDASDTRPYHYPATSNSLASRFSPYKAEPTEARARSQRPQPTTRERTMIQHAWHTITTSDPLLDSDEDASTEHDRLDYLQRLDIVCRLRGKSPTPELERRAFEKRAYMHRPA